MASNAQLTKDWIQYLKNNHIVSMQSDPKSGKLNYRRQVNADDVIEFLQVKTDYSDNDIHNAIRTVLGSRAGAKEPAAAADANVPATVNKPDGDVSDWHQKGMSPGAPPPDTRLPPPSASQSPRTKKYNTDDATDVEYREYKPQKTLGNKPPPAARPQYKRLKEDFRDKSGAPLSEKDVESIFNILATNAAAKKSDKGVDKQQSGDQSNSGKSTIDYRSDEINKLKTVIRDSMNDQQRMSLWRALNNA